MPNGPHRRPARTVLEQRIRERRQTFEEFAEAAERYARDHGEVGTLSVRHLQRLAAGHRADAKPLGPVRPATARLLEGMLSLSTDELLARPSGRAAAHALTVAVAVVIRESQVLLVRRRSVTDSGDSTWQFPAGIVKPDVAPETVAVDETAAETGVQCVFVRPLGSRLHPDTSVVCRYVLCCYVAGEVRNGDLAENTAVVWIGRAEVTQLVPSGRIFTPILEVLAAR